jgi:hypothetical protein
MMLIMLNEEIIEQESTKLTEDIESTERENIIGAIENLSARFPKLKAVIFAFLTTTSVLSPDTAHSTDKPYDSTVAETMVAGQSSIREKLVTLNDANFKVLAEKMLALINSNTNELPANTTYLNTLNYSNLNNEESINNASEGDLPESGSNILITSRHAHGQIEKDSYLDGANSYSLVKSTFAISPLENVSVVEGEQIETQGIGSSLQEALQNALAESMNQLGVSIENETSADTEELVNQNAVSFTKATSQQIISKYNIVTIEKNTDDANNPQFRVLVSVTSGKIKTNE